MHKNEKNTQFIECLCSSFSNPLRDVLVRLLDPLPHKRISIKEFLAHQWTTKPHTRELSELYGELPFLKTDRLKQISKTYFKDY